MAIETSDLTAHEAIVRSVYDAVNRRSPRALTGLCTDDVVQDVQPLGVLRGKQQVAAHHEALFAAFPDLHVQVSAMAVEDDHVLAHWRATGHFTGAPIRGLQPTGAMVDVRGTDCFTLDSGLIRRVHVAVDGLTVARQLGLIPQPGSLGDRAVRLVLNLRTRALGLLSS